MDFGRYCYVFRLFFESFERAFVHFNMRFVKFNHFFLNRIENYNYFSAPSDLLVPSNFCLIRMIPGYFGILGKFHDFRWKHARRKFICRFCIFIVHHVNWTLWSISKFNRLRKLSKTLRETTRFCSRESLYLCRFLKQIGISALGNLPWRVLRRTQIRFTPPGCALHCRIEKGKIRPNSCDSKQRSFCIFKPDTIHIDLPLWTVHHLFLH